MYMSKYNIENGKTAIVDENQTRNKIGSCMLMLSSYMVVKSILK